MELTPTILAALIALVRKHTGIAMTERKSVLLERRLRPRLQALSLNSYQEYLERLERDEAEIPHFIDLVTTNDTLFFRTQHVWDYFSGLFLPEWWRAHHGKTLKIWSAAAASGEELYSIAMLCEQFKQATPAFRYHIHATDISRQMLAMAGAGHYEGRSVERLQSSHPELYKKYFITAGKGVRVPEQLKKDVTFAQHNLLQSLRPAQRFDLIFLRNVLIYFDIEHQQTVLRQARHSMAPHARLILGESETISRLETAYQYEQTLVYKLDEAAA